MAIDSDSVTYKLCDMKRIILLMTLLCILSCNEDDDPTTLPPATQTGEGIFACTVNGNIFIDDRYGLTAYYQYIDGAYYLSVSGTNPSENPSSILIQSLAQEVNEGETYQLRSPNSGSFFGGAAIRVSENDVAAIYTTEELTGELTITNFDEENNILSGEFWFNLWHATFSDTIKVRNGRFDLIYGE